MASETNSAQMLLDSDGKDGKVHFNDNLTPKGSPFPHTKRPQGVREVIKMYSLYQRHEPSSSLSRLVYDGDTRRVRACLSSDDVKTSELDAIDRNGFSALHYAAQLNRVEILNMLLNSGASIDVRGESAMTPLHVASRYASEQVVHALLMKGSDPSFKTKEGFTALHFAARTGNMTIVRAILENKATMVNARDIRGATPLHDACARGHLELCGLLIEHNAAINARTVEGSTPLHISACNGDYPVVELLLEKAVLQEINLQELLQSDLNQLSVLHSAVRGGSSEVVELLLRKGAKINESQTGMQTVLHEAAFIGRKRLMDLLISKGAKLNTRDSANKTPLHSAALMGRVDSIDILLKKGANIEDKDGEGLTPFLSAVTVGHLSCVKFLLDSGADIKAQDNILRSCLHIAVEAEDEEMLALLLQYSGSELLNMADKRERTPLHYAALSKECKIMESLLEKGSRYLVKDENLKTPLHLAAEFSKLKNIDTLLFASTSSVFEKDELGRTPLHYAAMNGRSKVCANLLNCTEDIDTVDINHWSPLLWAASSGSVETVEVLLERGASTDSHDSEGNTALHVAATHGHVALITCLLDRGARINVNNDGLNCLDFAIENELHLAIKTIVQHERWREVFEARGKNAQSLLSKLIDKAPAAAEAVFDQCIQRSSHNRRSLNYTVTYDFRLLDPGPEDVSGTSGKRFFGLSELLYHGRENLVQHSLPRKLLQSKWKRFGFPLYAMNLLMYLVFVCLLTAFMLTERKQVKLPKKGSAKTSSEEDFVPKSNFNTGICYAGLAFVVFHILKEFYQMYIQRWKYFLSIQNLLDWTIYMSGFLYFLTFAVRIRELREGNFAWECGTVCIFLAYSNLIFQTRAIQNLGLYVTMFLEVLKTLIRVMSMFLMFILAYALVFYILFKEQDAFEDFAKSIVKTTAMTIGEMNYEEILIANLDQSVNKSGIETPLVPYPGLSNVFFYIFMLTMPIVLMNLLVGLAVGDIDAIRKTSHLRRIAAQINFLKEVESRYPLFITRRLYRPDLAEQPNATPMVRWKKVLFGGNNDEELEDDLDSSTTKELTRRYVRLDKRIGKTKKRVKTLALLMERQNHILETLSTSRTPVDQFESEKL